MQETEPDRFRSASRAARAAERADQAEEARRHYARLQEVAAADTRRPELEAACRHLGRG